MAQTATSANLSFRSICDDDQDFLRGLYASTRADEMAMVPWSETQKEEFLQQQFDAQHGFYQEKFPDAQFSIVQQSGVDIGRLYLDRRSEEIGIIDIALLPGSRGLGLGTQLMNGVLEEAREAARLLCQLS